MSQLDVARDLSKKFTVEVGSMARAAFMFLINLVGCNCSTSPLISGKGF